MVVATERKNLKKLEACIAADIDEDDLSKVTFLVREDCAAYLEEIDPGGQATQTVHGYKVRLRYQALTDPEQKLRRDAIGK